MPESGSERMSMRPQLEQSRTAKAADPPPPALPKRIGSESVEAGPQTTVLFGPVGIANARTLTWTTSPGDATSVISGVPTSASLAAGAPLRDTLTS